MEGEADSAEGESEGTPASTEKAPSEEMMETEPTSAVADKDEEMPAAKRPRTE